MSAASIQRALSEMSRAQSDHFQKYGKHDPILQRRIDALRLRVKAEKKKKKGKKNSSKLKIG